MPDSGYLKLLPLDQLPVNRASKLRPHRELIEMGPGDIRGFVMGGQSYRSGLATATINSRRVRTLLRSRRGGEAFSPIRVK